MVLNILFILFRVEHFVGQNLPHILMLWVSAILWFVAPIVNLYYIFSNKKTR